MSRHLLRSSSAASRAHRPSSIRLRALSGRMTLRERRKQKKSPRRMKMCSICALLAPWKLRARFWSAGKTFGKQILSSSHAYSAFWMLYGSMLWSTRVSLILCEGDDDFLVYDRLYCLRGGRPQCQRTKRQRLLLSRASRRSTFHEPIQVHAYRTVVKSYAIHILTQDVGLHLQLHGTDVPPEKTSQLYQNWRRHISSHRTN